MGLKLLDSPSDGAADIDGATDTDGRGDGNDRKMKDLMMVCIHHGSLLLVQRRICGNVRLRATKRVVGNHYSDK